jgi:hypothetical protein
MTKISRILNPVADELFRAGIFRLNLFSLAFWCITFAGTVIGLRCAALIGAVIGSVLGFISGYLFLGLCYCTFHFSFASAGLSIRKIERMTTLPNETMDRMRGSAVRFSPQTNVMSAIPLIGHLAR